jgi:membrane protease YdiL (CAAX protease family)
MTGGHDRRAALTSAPWRRNGAGSFALVMTSLMPRPFDFAPPAGARRDAHRWPRRWITNALVTLLLVQLVAIPIVIPFVAAGEDIPIAAAALAQLVGWAMMMGVVARCVKRYPLTGTRRDVAVTSWKWSYLGYGVVAAISGLIVSVVLSNLIPIRQKQGAEDIGQQIRDSSAGTVGLVIFAIVVAIGAPIVEELFFRGLLQTAFTARYGPWIGIASSSVIFGAIHFEPLNVIVLSALGAVFGFVRYRTGSIWPSMIAHAINNTLAVIAILSTL